MQLTRRPHCHAQVTHADEDKLTFDIIIETLRATSLGALQEGSSVNYERSARVGDEIGGHNVSGHVCTKATVARVEDSENNRRLTFSVRPLAGPGAGPFAKPCRSRTVR